MLVHTLVPWRHALAACMLAVAALLAQPAVAQDADADAGQPGRVSIVDGSVFRAGQDRATEWDRVDLNEPVVTGDNLWVSGDGHAEIDFGRGELRLGADTNVHVSRFDAGNVALFVAQGGVVLRVRALEPGLSVRVDTANAQVDIARPGLYRVDVSTDPPQTWVVVREGEAMVALPGGAQQVLPGQSASVSGAQPDAIDLAGAGGLDALDAWSADRDRVYDRARVAMQYVSPTMVGYADLDSYGQWERYPEYGAVWFPSTVVADWAPYRYGHWVWLTAWGWTWVDDAPWGYAPFHYGRWAYIGGRWGWCPGAYVARPVWAPALVAWYGGSGWSYSVSYGSPVFGWVPLGWREPLVPWWRQCSSRCYERYNRPYAVNVAERPNRPPTFHPNARVPGAITAVPGAAFREQRPVAANRVPLSGQVLASAPPLAMAPQVKPLRVQPGVPAGSGAAPLPAGRIAAQVKPAAVAPVGSAVPPAMRSGPAINAAPPAMRSGPAINAVPPTVRSGPAINAVPPGVRSAPAVNAVPPREPARVDSVPAPRLAPQPAPYVAPVPRGTPAPQAPISAVPPAPRAPMAPAPVPRVAPAPVPGPGSAPAITAVPPAPRAPVAPAPMPHVAPAPPGPAPHAPPPPPPPPREVSAKPAPAPKGPPPAQN